jgi:hypothetical protein
MADGNKKKPDDVNISKMKRLFGFESVDLKSWESFVAMMNRPEDPSNLAIFRILFGIPINKDYSKIIRFFFQKKTIHNKKVW